MRVVILGGAGFIGSHIAAHHAERGDTVRAVDCNFPILRREWWSEAAVHLADLRDPLNAREAIKGADYVYHFAADMGGVGYFHSDADPHAAATNMRIDLNVLEACRAAGVPFFYSSSACAYPITDQTHGTAHTLHEGLLGLGPADAQYGEQKRYMALQLNKEPLARVGIFHTIYGPGQEWDGPRAKFPPAICRKVKDPKRIEIWGDGTQARTFLYIDDAVRKIVTVAEAPFYDGPVNIGSDEEVTIRECADWLCDYADREPDYLYREDKPTGVMARACDNTLYVLRYGRRKQTTAREGLIRLYEWLP